VGGRTADMDVDGTVKERLAKIKSSDVLLVGERENPPTQGTAWRYIRTPGFGNRWGAADRGKTSGGVFSFAQPYIRYM